MTAGEDRAHAIAPSVTLLVIAYRMRATIGEAVRAALAQTHPCDIIVSDDSSGDGTLEAAREAIADDPRAARVTLRSTARNLGLCAHMNELAQLARGDILVCSSGDDISYPQRVRELVDAFAANPRGQLVGSSVDDVDAGGKLLAANVRGLPQRVDQRWFLHRGKLVTVLGASMAVRRELLTALPPLQGTVEDNMLSLRAVLLGDCLCLQRPLLAYRLHGGNLNDWMFDRSGDDYAAYERRHRRVIAMYRDIAADQRRCVAARPGLPEERRQLGLSLAEMYELEAEMREAVLDRPRPQWIGPLWRGLRHPGLRRKSAERALKLLLPRRWFGSVAKLKN
ncbi:MAG TPA: glycosyltransferase [Rhodanobacteraceae bacterium]|nr:glycosyltransferase [Rhodanobacteraceae bacterium]